MGHAQIGRAAHKRAHRLYALPVAHGSRQAAQRRPAPVSVHDDGNMARHRILAAGIS
ncbi:hypothetical protein GCM10007420_06570 [Glycocaulis albus]|uniref:Uncharacterized protein n=1 Tax=Glycocaulis albus TaxID=1382801 RepID=A0ABQ1XHP1_9PROT|nr:hypothetical protein GCM10007420_06570 [Glycocaulis albus]